jgi:hypothetical protein
MNRNETTTKADISVQSRRNGGLPGDHSKAGTEVRNKFLD